MPWNVRVGYIEADAVPGPIFVDGGIQKLKTTADTVLTRSCKHLSVNSALPNARRFAGGGTNGGRGVMECIAQIFE